MDLSALQPRCEDCAALCCVVTEFTAGDRFPEDRPACEPCRHLHGHGCAIYAEREAKGYRGCVAFTCYGAGQAVVQDLFGGESWLRDEARLAPMKRAFLRLFAVQEARFILETMAFSGLSEARDAEREAMLDALDPGGPWTEARLAEVEAACPAERVRRWVADGSPGG